MRIVSIAKAKNKLSRAVDRVVYDKERMILKHRGKNIAALIPIENLKLLEKIEDRIDLEDAQRALKAARKGKTIPLSQLKKELGL